MTTSTKRHQYILQKLEKEGNVTVTDLCQELDVSTVTIRKDLKLLEEKNLLYRTHGGATASNPYIADRPVNEKVLLQAVEKQAIGHYAAGLIERNDCVLIASGTTVQYLAKNMISQGNLTVVTAALNVAAELVHHSGIEIIQLGGIVRKTSTSVTGTYAESILQDFSFTKLFLGVDGIDLDFGLTTSNMMEAQLNKKMIVAAQKTIVLADSAKFGKRGFGKICEFDEIDQIITDSHVSPRVVDILTQKGIQVIIAPIA
ncbi:MAG: DeoR/GlpR family DNA-binding transcription regulator [Niabella sp.]